MPKKPSNGPTRAQKKGKTRKAGTTRKRNTKKVPRKIVTLDSIYDAIKEVHRTPPARIPITHSGGPRRNHFPSLKLRHAENPKYRETDQQIFRVEGTLELEFAHSSDLDPAIESFFPQPFEIDFEGYRDLGKTVPDFIVFPHDSAPYLVDVKPWSKAQAPRIKALLETRQKALEETVGIELRIVTDKELCIEPKKSNLHIMRTNLISSKKKLQADLDAVKPLIEELNGCCYLDNLLESHLTIDEVSQGVCYGIFTGQISTPHNTSWGNNLIVQIED